jgi:HEAT repeat protein
MNDNHEKGNPMSDPLEEAKRSLEKLMPMIEAKHAELRGQNPSADAQIADSLAQTKAILSELDAGAKPSGGGMFGWLSNLGGWFGKPNIQKLALKGDVKGLIRALERYDDYDIVTEAIPALADFPESPEAVAMLLKMARRSHEVFRRDAIKALSRVGGDKVIAELIKHMDDGEFGIRQEAIAALGRLRAKAAVSRLILSLNENNDECTHSAEALTQIGDPAAIPALRKRLSTEKSDYRQGCFRTAISALEAYIKTPDPSRR